MQELLAITDPAEFKRFVVEQLDIIALKNSTAGAEAAMKKAAAKPTEKTEGIPAEWTKEEVKMLFKACKELPVGTRDRYDRIADYIRTHCHTPYTRPTKVCDFVQSLFLSQLLSHRM